MQLFDKYLPYWPVLGASLLFLILGLWWRLSAARAMELSPKSADWVKRYRSGGFPFRVTLPPQPKLRFWALALAAVTAAALAAGQLANLSMTFVGIPDLFFRSSYGLYRGVLFVVGAVSVYFLLTLLFDSPWVSLPGTLLFAASAARGHAESCFLALSLLFLLLYLRTEKAGFPGELLYLCAVLALAPLTALRSPLVWLVLCYPPVHWYKLIFQSRAKQLSGGQLALSLAAALLCWAAAFLLGALLLQFLNSGFRGKTVLRLLKTGQFGQICSRFLSRLTKGLFAAPTRGMTIDLMVDAPLFGFGLWGCFSAWTLGRKRRDVRGLFALAVLAALLVVWLLTGCYALTLGLTLTTACILRDADVGKKRLLSILFPFLGILWYIGIQTAAWNCELPAGLLERLI